MSTSLVPSMHSCVLESTEMAQTLRILGVLLLSVFVVVVVVVLGYEVTDW